MRKIFSLIITLVLLLITKPIYANSWETLIADTQTTSYIYYFGQWCSHCANVDKYMRAVDWYEKLNVEKLEIYFDDDNREKYLAAGERLWIPEKELWIPFLVINENGEETHLSWDVPVIDYFKWFLWEAPENPNKKIILIIMWVLVVLIPVFIIKSSK